MGMGIILSALSAGGNSAAQSVDQQQKVSDETRLLQQRAELEEQKTKNVEQFKNDLANAPANRAGALLSAATNQQQPVIAAPVKTLSGSDPNSEYQESDGGQTTGLVGDLGKLKAFANTLPDSSPDKAPLLAQIARQASSDQGTAQDAVAGQTRAPTMQEAMQAAMQKALANGDAQSYSALKTLAGDKYVPIPDGGLLNAQTGEVIQPSATKLERQLAIEDARHKGRTDIEDQKAASRERAADIAFQRIHTLTPEMEVQAKAIANGQLPALTGMSLRSPGAGLVMARVLEINPDYSGKDYGVGSKAEKDFATGKQGNSVRSFNVGIAHLDTLTGLASALNNGDLPLFSKIGNAVAVQTGQEAPTDFNAAKKIVGDEIVKAVTGSSGAVADREALEKSLSAASSPAQLLGVIKTYKNLMAGQLMGLAHQYKATTGKDDFESKYLTDEARQVFHGAAPAPVSSATISAKNSVPDDISNLLDKYK